MGTIVQLRRDLKAGWNANKPIPFLAELCYTYDRNKLKVGNGNTPWESLSYLAYFKNNSRTMFTSFIAGPLVANTYVGFYTTRAKLAIPDLFEFSVATCMVAPTVAQTFNILYKAYSSTTISTIGSVSFAAGATTGTFAFATGYTNFAINEGDALYIQTQGTVDTTISNICIDIILFTKIYVIPEYQYMVPLLTTTDGTLGLFFNNTTGVPNFTYNFSDGSIATTQFTYIVYSNGGGAGTGTGSVGILAIGSVDTLISLDYTSITFSDYTLLNVVSYGSATGNSTLGLFIIGNISTTTNIFTYATNVASLGTVLTATSSAGASASNSASAIIALGGSTTTTNLYTYSGATVAASTVLTASLDYGTAAGNATVAIIVLGNSTTTTNSFTYSGAVVAAGTVLTTTSFTGSGCGNSVLGVFSLNNNYLSNTYNYSSSVVDSGTTLPNTSSGTAFSNGIASVSI